MSSNQEKAARAIESVFVYQRKTERRPRTLEELTADTEAMSTSISDLLCDLLHLSESYGLDPLQKVTAAVVCYEEEVEEEESGNHSSDGLQPLPDKNAEDDNCG